MKFALNTRQNTNNYEEMIYSETVFIISRHPNKAITTTVIVIANEVRERGAERTMKSIFCG